MALCKRKHDNFGFILSIQRQALSTRFKFQIQQWQERLVLRKENVRPCHGQPDQWAILCRVRDRPPSKSLFLKDRRSDDGIPIPLARKECK